MKRSASATLPQKALVVGLGISGQAVAELLLRQGVSVTATDLRDEARFAATLRHLQVLGAKLHLGPHRIEDFLEADQIIVSPGVPLDLEPLRQAAARDIEIIGELEWAWRQVQVPVVAITGTNGKTTTTSLLGAVLKAAGKRVFVGGNIGTPLSQWLLSGETADLLVLEVSSFQLDTAPTFSPDVAILLNITEDHLDRYAGFAAYAESKFGVFRNQQADGVAIVNYDDPQCRVRLPQVPSRLLTYSRQFPETQAFIADYRLTMRLGQFDPYPLLPLPNTPTDAGNGAQNSKPETRNFSDQTFDLSDCPLQGPHNAENIAAVVLAATALGVAADTIREVLSHYHGLPHRVEWVASWHGIDFYDDSKGTNVGAVIKALENFERPVLLLAGGRDKYGSYEPLEAPLRDRVKGLFLFGEAAPRMHQALCTVVPTRLAGDLGEAFAQALAQADPGDVVLLSPACSSFDQYESYAQRGDHFKRLVSELANGREAGCRS